MDYAGMSQAVPPAYAQLIFGQVCMQECQQRFGIQSMTYDDYEADPARCARRSCGAVVLRRVALRTWVCGVFARPPARPWHALDTLGGRETRVLVGMGSRMHTHACRSRVTNNPLAILHSGGSG